MLTAILETIKSVCAMVSQYEEVKETSIERQSETTINKSVKNASKAIKAANKALDIASKYADSFDKKDLKEFNKQKKSFDNNIGSK